MPTSYNRVILLGNLTRNPELRDLSSGTAVADFGVAVNRHYTNSDGDARDEVCFIDVETWGKQARNCSEYLQKGASVFVEGHLKMDQWEDRDSGQKRSRLLVRAEKVQFLNGSARRQDDSSPAAAPVKNSSNDERRRNNSRSDRR